MATESESADDKNRRLLNDAHNALTELFSRKIGNAKSYGDSRVVLVWKAGALIEIRVEDSASIR